MKWTMFLDDIRNPMYSNSKSEVPWVIVRSFVQAVKEVEIRNSLPVYISFDHDLGCTFDEDCNMIDLPSGYDFAKWIVEQDMNGTYKLHEDFEFNVHSANPVGKVNIEKYFNSYLKFKREKEAVNENS